VTAELSYLSASMLPWSTSRSRRERRMTDSMRTSGAQAAEERRRHVTTLLLNWTGGDDAALQELVPLVYDELRRLAR
jgi:hypothetical protein